MIQQDRRWRPKRDHWLVQVLHESRPEEGGGAQSQRDNSRKAQPREHKRVRRGVLDNDIHLDEGKSVRRSCKLRRESSRAQQKL